MLCVIKNNDEFRADWTEIHALIDSDKTDKLATKIGQIIQMSSSPASMIATEITRFTASLISEYLSKKGDEQLGLLCLSLIREEDYRYGERKFNGAQDLTGNMTVDYSLFSYAAHQ
ncbi:hypothetical protein ACIP6T_24495 [Pantoea sp. NPDC088449]|uniref:hypothetical protein n=1 Tax=Pantoea sp. NPDC088449 TaxID=3364392 RepID=UPI00382CB922